MFEAQKAGNKRSYWEICLNTRAYASPIMGQDYVYGGVHVLWLHAASVANVLWKPRTIKLKVTFGNKAKLRKGSEMA